MFYRQTWAEINLDAIYDNVANFKKYLAKDKALMATVKADGYGHGAVPVAQSALRAGADWLAVALLEEGIELRQAGIQAPVLVLGYVLPEYLPLAQRHRLSVTVPDYAYFEDMAAQVSSEEPPLSFHLKLDTGMGRLGIPSLDELEQMVQAYMRLNHASDHNLLNWEGVYSHLATADEQDDAYLRRQLACFDERVELIFKSGIKPRFIHLANSAGLIRQTTGRHTNLVRLGISMYGLLPADWMGDLLPFKLQPAFSLYSALSQVKQVPVGHGISYGCTYRAREEEWIGTIPIGYADGYSRLLSNRAHVLIDGRRYPVVGRVCMDQMMVKLDRPYKRNQRVTLIGREEDSEVSVDELAGLIGTINYEIPCQISKRVPRVYVGSKPEVQDLLSKDRHLV
ncbi:Alanine racemase [Caldalkalibacillus thermarum TA2.A1]|uniref:Alanine racemase n=1 Tax=Caldalkalibacillus thermarum (strain TA2.A1) TaxID=986075 RepID=F5L787_CALTT|nr:alanine racemase [Caldalkalibacillus thermarum]EGL82808.1 Alanine racemase [Caldalkalibacillus thermarum TA2.A1]QZT34553.1 alanine racemase [Caldalkalibacillus thermarum TA2.A1]